MAHYMSQNSREFICDALYVSQIERILTLNFICGAQYASQIVVLLFVAHAMRHK